MSYTSTNPFFSNVTGYSGEQNLIDDLVGEQIRMYGIDIQYMPRKMINLDDLLHEATKSVFEVALPMPAYLKSFDGYDNGMELLTKFGVRDADEITLTISRSMFETYYSPFMEEFYKAQNDGEELDRLKGQTSHRPKEGDLIYFPFDDGIYEIKYTNFDAPFFQFGKGFIYELNCEKFEYSGETFSTGIVDIDDTVEETSFFQKVFTLAEGGTSTFEKFETVTLYNVEGLETPDLTAPDPIIPFLMYLDDGFQTDTNSVSARVVSWDITTRQLVLTDFSDADPEREDGVTKDVTVNDFDSVLIMGATAAWLSEGVMDQPVPFNDDETIQREFDKIKIVDDWDRDPFGFN